ncbi:MAG: GGDEF domain-containing protein, partial [Lachnospiraceae bacterium]|nr:GGDEF domain-containing protein [Lachnospiraceae bacterium]
FGDWENTKAFVGSAYHFVILPFDLQNKEIEITITATENGAYSSLPVVVVSPSDKAYSDFANEREIGMMMSIFLMVAGFAMTVISIFGMTWDEDFKPILMIGLFAFLSGIWSFFAMKGAELFSNRFVFNSLVEYVALYIMPIPIIRLTLREREHLGRIEKIVLKTVNTLILVLLGVFLFLHFTNVVHISQMTMVFHLLLLVTTPILLFVRPGQWKVLNESERLFQIGMWISVAVAIGDVIWYNISKYAFEDVSGVADLALPLGFLLMVIVFMGSYLLDLYARRLDKNEKEILMRMAYEDELTGLGNRLKGEDTLAEASKWRDEYAIINIDLNGLKKVNDKYGHSKGDVLITTFSDILKEVFGKEKLIARMGGDEFLIIVQGTKHMAGINGLIEKMSRREKEESYNQDMEISAAYGIARSNELTYPDPEALYRMADQRMYKMKKNSRKGRES